MYEGVYLTGEQLFKNKLAVYQGLACYKDG